WRLRRHLATVTTLDARDVSQGSGGREGNMAPATTLNARNDTWRLRRHLATATALGDCDDTWRLRRHLTPATAIRNPDGECGSAHAPAARGARTHWGGASIRVRAEAVGGSKRWGLSVIGPG
ncbi:MAG TPA: hypothetical protein VKP30_14210, partial [Polyangiaceae bacterium]|nr:hypothetical protein [Polyangiaceae bacterium]